jgi:hypothetical protein
MRFVFALALCFAAGTGFAKKQPAADSNQPQATVLLRDGTTMAGTVVESTPSEIKLAGSDGVTGSVAMNRVKSIDYGETAAAQQPESAPPPQATAPAPEATPPEPQPKHEPHYRPTEEQVTTKTYVVPAGTQVPVRVEETIDSSKAVEGQVFAAEVTHDNTRRGRRCSHPARSEC